MKNVHSHSRYIPAVMAVVFAGCAYHSPTAPTVLADDTVTITRPPPAPAPVPVVIGPTTIAVGFNVTPYNPHPGELVTISLEATDGTAPVSYAWTFGDGAAATGNAPTHTYQSEGVKTIRVTATDATGRTGTGYREIEVHRDRALPPSSVPPPSPPPPPPPPPAAPALSVALTCTPNLHGTVSPCNVNVDYGGVLLPATAVTRVDWDWGDGQVTSNNGVVATHTYANAGTYSVFATVTAGTAGGLKTATVSGTLGVK